MFSSNYGSSASNFTSIRGEIPGDHNSARGGPGFFQGIDFDEINGVNAFPFKLNASFAFTSAGGHSGHEFVVSFKPLINIFRSRSRLMKIARCLSSKTNST